MNGTIQIRRAQPIDAEALAALTLASKNHWNYGTPQIAIWRDELSISSDYIRQNAVYKLQLDVDLVGFYAYEHLKTGAVKLNFLFVAPRYIGHGYGGLLLNDFLKRVKGTVATKILLDADPHAQAFYAKYGFKVIGQLPSSIPGRTLPIMQLEPEE
ncbi:GNAT family N-acetyltransferase [Maribacter sp. 2-571]|uniref:GNAT family N-acetyltransferase n=1 Tax=Maribacter sp. 2-571 TaxID=3417569 RepID=UPI003D33B456